MNYGYFDDPAGEYVITSPDTPRPWSNYLGSAEFGGVITNNAAGYTFYKSAAQGRLTRFNFNTPASELCGRYIYVRDEKDGDVWSTTWMPVGKPPGEFKTECRHGTGYSRITSTYRDITSDCTYFIPLGQTYEVWQVKLINERETPCKLKVFPFVEPQCNWSAEDDTKNLQYNQYIATTSSPEPGLITISSNRNMPEDPDNFTNKDQQRHLYFALTGIPAESFDGDLNSFLGSYGNKNLPGAVWKGSCSGSEASGDMPCGAFGSLVTLEPGESIEFACVFGIGKAESTGRKVRDEMSDAVTRNTALEKIKEHWRKRLQVLKAETPDEKFNSMVNLWAPYNSLMTFYWSRTASLVYAGERDGLGYRDTLQDIVAASSLVTEEAGERLELMITGQYSTGGCKPVVQPFHHRPGEEAEPEAYRSDDALWMFNAVPAYVNEIGDLNFYRKVLPFADRGEASVLGHLRKAIEFSLERSGEHGLPCGLHADWNDCIRLGEKGESVFVAFQLRLGLEVYQCLCRKLKEIEEAEWAVERLRELDENLEAYAWDGEWYLRAYRYDGLKFGSSENEEGRIFMNPQTWSVICGHAKGERGEQVMKAVHEKLNTKYGVMVCAPPYVNTDPAVCLGRLFNPGMKENGGIFNHTQGWGILAAAKLGMGNRAYEYLKNVLPSSFNEIAEIREVEPYAVCQSTHSSYSPRFGSGRVSWLSGSATWNYVAMVYGILGIQPEEEGLRIDPCIPASWEEMKITRLFRGVEVRLTVRNPAQLQKGVHRLIVNGKAQEGNLLKLFEEGGVLEVVAELSES